MTHQLQPDKFTCLPTSFAIVLGIPVKDVLKKLKGRDFHIQEMVDLCLELGYTVTPIDAMPEWDGATIRMSNHLIGHVGVLTGESPTGARHAVAWDGKKIIDPGGLEYKIEDFGIETFWRVDKLLVGSSKLI